MLADKPLLVEEILNDADELNKVKNILIPLTSVIESNTSGSVTIAIKGDWGSGKTTILKLLESFSKDYCNSPTIFFEAWKYQNETNILIPLISQIKDIIKDEDKKEKLQSLINCIYAVGLSAADIVLKSATLGQTKVKDINYIFKLIEDTQQKIISEYNKNLSSLKDVIQQTLNPDTLPPKNSSSNSILWEKKLQGTITKPNKKCFTLIIDDLDRLIPEKAFKVIEALRFYFDIDNVVIIMGINDKILNKYVDKCYGIIEDNEKANSQFKGEKFLDKIFQWSYEIPLTTLNNLHLRSFKDKVKNTENLKIFLHIDRLPHRLWVKFVNRLEQTVLIKKKFDDLDIFSAFVKELLPHFELFSRKFPSLLSDIYKIKIDNYNDILEAINTGKTFDNIKKTLELENEILEAINIMINDKTYFDFPWKNITILKQELVKLTEN